MWLLKLLLQSNRTSILFDLYNKKATIIDGCFFIVPVWVPIASRCFWGMLWPYTGVAFERKKAGCCPPSV